MRLPLLPHPDTPPAVVESVQVQLERLPEGGLWLEYCVGRAAGLALPPASAPERADELWKTTCFELFFKPAASEAYLEFNFSPSFRWAAYQFDSYRSGMRELAAEDPEVEMSYPGGEWFFLAAEPWPPHLVAGPATLGLAAVIEETDGTKSYWALAHAPDGPPDFHHPACFVLELPPAPGA